MEEGRDFSTQSIWRREISVGRSFSLGPWTHIPRQTSQSRPGPSKHWQRSRPSPSWLRTSSLWPPSSGGSTASSSATRLGSTLSSGGLGRLASYRLHGEGTLGRSSRSPCWKRRIGFRVFLQRAGVALPAWVRQSTRRDLLQMPFGLWGRRVPGRQGCLTGFLRCCSRSRRSLTFPLRNSSEV